MRTERLEDGTEIEVPENWREAYGNALRLLRQGPLGARLRIAAALAFHAALVGGAVAGLAAVVARLVS